MTQKEKDEARKEVNVLSKMNHPNIVTYQDSFEEKGSIALRVTSLETRFTASSQ